MDNHKNITRTANGKYRVRVSCGMKRDGKRRYATKTCDTLREAEFVRDEYLHKLRTRENFADDMTLDDYYNFVFVPEREKRLTAATMRDYERHYRIHIKPAFGFRPLSTIKHREIQNLIDTKTHHVAKHVIATLKAILRDAWNNEYIDDEPMRRRFHYPPNTRPQRAVWTAETVAAALPAMRDNPLEALWLFMVGGGLRREEAYALFWRDVRFENVTNLDGSNSLLCLALIDDAVTIDDGRKSVKTAFSKRTAVIGAPFSKRLLELNSEPDTPICDVSLCRVAPRWRKLFTDGQPLDGFPYVALSRMRATHETIMQSGGIADTLNARVHGRTEHSSVGYKNYLNPSISAFTQAAKAVETVLNQPQKFTSA